MDRYYLTYLLKVLMIKMYIWKTYFAMKVQLSKIFDPSIIFYLQFFLDSDRSFVILALENIEDTVIYVKSGLQL